MSFPSWGGVRTCEEPDPGIGAHLITQPSNETSGEEAQYRTQCLPVGDTEGQVAGSFPQSGNRQSELKCEHTQDEKVLRNNEISNRGESDVPEQCSRFGKHTRQRSQRIR